MPIPKIDVTGKYGSSYQQLGRGQEASGHLVGLGNSVNNLLGTAAQVARYARAEMDKDTPEDTLWKLDTVKNINNGLTKHAVNNKFDPAKFDEEAQKTQTEMFENVPEKHRKWFLKTFKETANQYNVRITAAAEKHKYDLTFEGLMEHSESFRAEAMAAAARGDQAGYNAAYQKWQTLENQMYDQGFLQIAQKINRAQDFKDSGLVQQYTGFAKAVYNQPEKLNGIIKQVQDSNKFTPELKKSIVNGISSGYSTWQAQNKAANKDLADSADFTAKALNEGIEPEGVDIAATITELAEHGLTDKAQKLQTAYNNRKISQTFAGLDLAQMDNALTGLRKDVKSEADIDLIKGLQKIRDKAETEIEKDPLNWAISHGVIDDDGLDTSKPESIAARKKNAAIVREKYNLPYTPILTTSEKKSLSNTVAKADPVEQLNIIGQINNSFGEDAGSVFADIAPKNPELAIAGKLMNEGKADIAAGIIEGMDIKSKESGFVPNNDINLQNEFGQLNNALRNFNEQDIRDVKAAIIARATGLNKQTNIFSNGDAIAEDKLNNIKQATKDVLGGEIVHIGGWFRDGYDVLLPENVNQGEFEDWIDGLKDKDIGDAYFGDKKAKAKDLSENGAFIYDGDGYYTVTIGNALITDAEGNPLRIKYKGSSDE